LYAIAEFTPHRKLTKGSGGVDFDGGTWIQGATGVDFDGGT
jgi:hypothetical protein